jgi:hypothetical protein
MMRMPARSLDKEVSTGTAKLLMEVCTRSINHRLQHLLPYMNLCPAQSDFKKTGKTPLTKIHSISPMKIIAKAASTVRADIVRQIARIAYQYCIFI